jgi:glycosyltransferase involved in cell wall biosynthesis
VLGGAETLLPRFAAAAPGAGIRLSIACLEELDGNPAAAPLEALGVPPVNLDLKGRPGPSALLAVRRHIAAVRPQIVHTHLGTSDLLGGVAAKSLGIPATSTLHSTRWEGRTEHAIRWILRFCDARLIAVSDSARSEYLRHGWSRPEQIVTIHNGIDVQPATGSGAEVRRELGLAADDQVVGMVSALRPEKGHDVAIEAIRTLLPRFPRLRLLIVGQGDLREELERRAAEMAGAVVLAGLRRDVMHVLDALDICLQPSRADAFPTTLLEAMAASVPIVASAVGGIPEIISNGQTGVLVAPPPEPAGLATVLAELLQDPARRARLAAAARTDYEDRLTAQPWVRRTRELYDSVLAERS